MAKIYLGETLIADTGEGEGDSTVKISTQEGNEFFNGASIWGGTQTSYDSLNEHDSDTLYFIIEPTTN